VIDVDRELATRAGQLLGRSQLDGHRCALDALVAAVALAEPSPVVVLTSDVDDMSTLVEDPSRDKTSKVRIRDV
jgi:predicted nucleic acid-binding protein